MLHCSLLFVGDLNDMLFSQNILQYWPFTHARMLADWSKVFLIHTVFVIRTFYKTISLLVCVQG